MFTLYTVAPSNVDSVAPNGAPICYINPHEYGYPEMAKSPVTMEAQFGEGNIACRGGIGKRNNEEAACVAFFPNPFKKKPGDEFTAEEKEQISSLFRNVPSPIRLVFTNKESLEATIKNMQSILDDWNNKENV